MSEEINILGFAGSLRKGSFNRALLRAAQAEAPPRMKISLIELNDVPLYNGDVEAAGDPPPVARLKEAIRAADGLLIAAPEYNHGVPGVLKNTIDWASRPANNSALSGKPAGIIGASPGITGTARSQTQLRQAFVFTNTITMLQPELLVFRAHEKFDGEGNLTDERTKSLLKSYLQALAEWIARFRT